MKKLILGFGLLLASGCDTTPGLRIEAVTTPLRRVFVITTECNTMSNCPYDIGRHVQTTLDVDAARSQFIVEAEEIAMVDPTQSALPDAARRVMIGGGIHHAWTPPENASIRDNAAVYLDVAYLSQ